MQSGPKVMEHKKKSLDEEFNITNFLDKEKERQNRWANQHRWRNGGKHIPAKLQKYLKKQLRPSNGKET